MRPNRMGEEINASNSQRRVYLYQRTETTKCNEHDKMRKKKKQRTVKGEKK
jgi:hypothetical protein